ncbi:hypothetical protein AKO1_012556 [Acrasis kona]|uniref:Leucine carboxyl methyltransferase 1 n=1 Tax=Acrasis kona TaxID=1008807 RepID=A0AAW2YW14_9EUKA
MLLNHRQETVLAFDTTYWNLIKEVGKTHSLLFIETDFLNVVAQKSKIIQTQESLRSSLTNAKYHQDGSIHSDCYYLLPIDLRSKDALQNVLIHTKIDKRVPTLFLSECVLVYMEPEYSSEIIKYSSTFLRPFFVLYEQIIPNDNYGRVMVENLNDRGCGLKSIHEYPDLSSQRYRFLQRGYSYASANDLYDLYTHYVDQDVKRRIERIEWFDEFEEWVMILRHYCIVVAFGMEDGQEPVDDLKQFVEKWQFKHK